MVIAQHYGAGREKDLRANASVGILLLLGAGLLLTVLGLSVSEPVYRHFIKVPEEILDLTLKYFNIYLLGLVFQFGYNIFSSILRAVGDSAATLYFLIIYSIINVVLDLLFVAYWRWGAAGAAVATDLAQAASFFAAYLYMIKKYPLFRFRLREYTWNWQMAGQTCRVGLPIAFQLIAVSLGITLIQRAVNGFGTAMTASFAVGHRIEMFLNLPGNAFLSTLATFTGQNIGAGKLKRVRLGVAQTLFISVLMTLLISAFVWTMAEQIVDWFGLGEKAAFYCCAHLKAVALINIILSFYMPLFGVFQGSNHSAVPAFVAISALSVRVAVTYLFRYSDFLGYTIIWWNGSFGFSTGCCIAWCYYLSGRWRRNVKVFDD
ncbi:MATE family efflux transporter [bacterium]|nr:MATE family efflux transporter [bacterium]